MKADLIQLLEEMRNACEKEGFDCNPIIKPQHKEINITLGKLSNKDMADLIEAWTYLRKTNG